MLALVTGANGFVGSHVVRALLRAGVEVRGLVRPGSDRSNLAGLPLELVEGDLADAAAVARAVAGATQVFHCAALYAFWARDPATFYETNVEGTKRVLLAAADAGAERIVYTSTHAAVHGALDEAARADETADFNLDDLGDHYIRAKQRAEAAALALARAGAPIVIVNPSGPLGPGDYKPTPTGQLMLEFLRGRLPGYTGGGINFVDVRDVAAGHLLAAQKGRPGERYLLTSRDLSLRDLLRLFADVTGLHAPWLRIPYTASWLGALVLETWADRISHRPPLLTVPNIRATRRYFYFSNRKAVEELGWSTRPLHLAVRDAVAYFIARGLVPERRRRAVEAYWAKTDGAQSVGNGTAAP